MKRNIHPTAVVGRHAELGAGVQVGPFCVISDQATIGAGTRLHSHVVVEGHVTIGSGCEIFPFAAIGTPPQDIKYKGEDTKVIIGDRNVIREYVSVHRASPKADGLTEIGHDNFIMAYCHIAHDCKLGSHIIMASTAVLGGHCVIQDHAVLGGMIAVHQFTRIGSFAMVAGFSGIGQDVTPFMIASSGGGERAAKLYGPNLVGLKRAGFSDEKIGLIKKAFRILFKSKLSFREAIEQVRQEIQDSPEVETILEFITAKSPRGIMR